MKKALLGILAAGLTASAANAAELSLRFAGGATEITMDQASQTATIQVVLNMNRPQDNDTANSVFSRCTGLDMRFEVGQTLTAGSGQQDPPAGSAPGWRNEFVADNGGAGKFSVIETSQGNGWDNTSTTPTLPVAFGRDTFHLSYQDLDESSAIDGLNNSGENVLATFTIHKDTMNPQGDFFIVFRVGAALPSIANGAASWSGRFQFRSQTSTDQWVMNNGGTGAAYVPRAGNPGDADGSRFATRRGEEVLFPLIIHNVPEPSSLALLALGGLAALRRKR